MGDKSPKNTGKIKKNTDKKTNTPNTAKKK